MFGYIVSPAWRRSIRELLDGHTFGIEKIGQFDGAAFLHIVQSAGQTPLEGFVIDLAASLDESAVVKGVQHLRLFRNNIRIVLLCEWRDPGDRLLSGLVSMGVWDILANENPDDEPLTQNFLQRAKQQLGRPPLYGNVVRWHQILGVELTGETGGAAPGASAPPRRKPAPLVDPLELEAELALHQPPIREKVVYRERLIGTIVLAVGGIERRTGTTYAALRCAQLLADRGSKVACCERNDPDMSPDTLRLYAETESLHAPGGFRMNEVDLLAGQNLDAAYSNYEYIVLDMGQLFAGERYSVHFGEFLRANAQLVTAGSSYWDFDRLVLFLRLMRERGAAKRLAVLLNFGNEKTVREFLEPFSREERELLQLEFFSGPFSPDIYKLESQVAKRLGEALEHTLKRPAKKRRLW